MLALLSNYCFSAVLVSAQTLEHADGQQAAHCRLDILGLQNGRLHRAGMNCTGVNTLTVALNSTYLRRFETNCTGINLATSCPSEVTEGAPYSCLVTICKGTVVLLDSRVSWVRGNPLNGLLCVLHNSSVEVYNSRFMNNQVRPLVVGGQARMLLHASNVLRNAFNGSGAGLWVEGNASVTISGGSRLQGITAREIGGGLSAVG